MEEWEIELRYNTFLANHAKKLIPLKDYGRFLELGKDTKIMGLKFAVKMSKDSVTLNTFDLIHALYKNYKEVQKKLSPEEELPNQ